MGAIAGLVCLHHGSAEAEPAERMAAALGWRGPLEDGAYRSPDGRAALAAQPLANETHDIWLVLDGEIQNHRTLRHSLELAGHRFRSGMDAEVAVHAYEQWGLDFPTHLQGSFALALWDDRRDRLVLARDRLGRKPLFVAEHRGRLAFASAIAPLLDETGLPRRLDPNALAQFLSLGAVPPPATLVAGVSKIAPGEMLVAGRNGPPTRLSWTGLLPSESRAAAIRALPAERQGGNLRTLLDCAVADRLPGGLPVGVWLPPSPGAVALAAIAPRLTGRPLTAVMVRDAAAPNPSPVEISGVEIIDRLVTAEDVADALPIMAARMAEPVVAPTMAGAWFAAQSLKAHKLKGMLADTGAEEMLLTHPAYDGARRAGLLGRLLGMLPVRLRPAVTMPAAAPAGLRPFGEDGADLLRHALPQAAASQPATPGWMRADPLARLGLNDTLLRLAEAEAPGMDAMAQAHGMEARLPFLDDSLLNFALAVPGWRRAPAASPRAMARRMLGDLVPATFLTRPLAAAELPLAAWLAGPLAPLLDALPQRWPLLNRTALARFRVAPGQGEALWPLLVLAEWCAGLGLTELAEPAPTPPEMVHSRS